MKILIYLIMLLILVGAMPDERPHTFCGRALAEARILYCFGPEMASDAKRSFHGDTWNLRKKTLVWPWLANRILKRDPGLVDECCLKPCYVNQLLSYC